jgi:hypothetical protein
MKSSAGLMLILVATVLACGSGGGTASPDAAAACDQRCRDAIALRSLREALKLVYNVTLSGKPVGPQDQTTPCLFGGTAHVYGQATSNANQGTTSADLTYVLDHCAFSDTSTDPNSTFQMTLTGTVTETGTIAVQPSSTTALQFRGSPITLSGTVYDPPIVYDESMCAVVVGQNGNDLSGTMCGRMAGLTL